MLKRISDFTRDLLMHEPSHSNNPSHYVDEVLWFEVLMRCDGSSLLRADQVHFHRSKCASLRAIFPSPAVLSLIFL